MIWRALEWLFDHGLVREIRRYSDVVAIPCPDDLDCGWAHRALGRTHYGVTIR